MVENARQGIFSYPGQILMPALAIASLALVMPFIGDGVRDALDPKSK